MCEILGLSLSHPHTVNSILRDFYTHSTHHPDGWGLSVFTDEDSNTEKESLPAFRSTYLRERLKEPIRAKTTLAHIRLATVGSLERKNCHPFVGRDADGRRWTLIHNGTIFDFPKLLKYSGIQQGSTDSERVLLYILDELNRERLSASEPLSAEERFDVLDRIVYEMSEGNKLNFILYDGEQMYAHVNSADSLFFRILEDGVLICTKPLKEGDWEAFPFTRLVAFQNGHCIAHGTNHGHIYHENEEALKQLYMTYSEL